MPCFTIKTTTVNVGKMDLGILQAGLEGAGYTVRQEGAALIFSARGSYQYHEYRDGALSLRGDQADATANSVKRAYAAQCVRQSLGREWRATEKAGEKSITFNVTSRR